MNVIHVNSGHTNTIYKSIVDNLFQSGVDQRVYKFVPYVHQDSIDYDDYVDIRQVYDKWNRYFFHIKHEKAQNDFMAYLEDKKPDIIHAHTLFSNGYLAYRAYQEKKIPYVVAVRGTDINIFFKYMLHLRKVGLTILLHASKIIFISPTLKKNLFDTYVPEGIRAQLEAKSTVIPNGIDEFYFDGVSVPKKRKEAGKLVVLTAAWIDKNKNQLTVCKALEHLRMTEGIDIDYRIIGGVQKEKTHQHLLKQLQSFDFVKIIPRMDKAELIQEIRAADISVMVSYQETFGLFYIESLLQNTPIIYTKNQGIDGFFEEGLVGYSADPHSELDIASKILKVLANYERLSSNTQEQTSQFTWSTVTASYKELYESVLTNATNQT
ncbi:glycosyltransferase family 4 protein [Enterococcus ureasiticus]|uniref:Glycosyl transferase family 1 n=1 Tax=Enterococcus ureasiticus TaxID=903984 RepID=A0A1E5GI96_9ENTE|nr:glycosyltransferase family 4 protein [Enterococcus ureasiticus]OEG11960.1 hypothetical protein BCR21_06910 [Enterococcus ureasiticus]